MNLFRNTQFDSAKDSMGKHLVIRFLPILVAAIIVYLLSGGFPPATWTTLAEVGIHWNTLQAQQNHSLVLPLVILIVQSLLLLFAWCALLWITIREINTVRRGGFVQNEEEDEEEMSAAAQSLLSWLRKRPQAPEPEDATPKEALVAVSNIRAGAKLAAKRRAIQNRSASSSPLEEPITGATMEPEILKNPFEDESDIPTPTPTPAPMPQAQPEKKPAVPRSTRPDVSQKKSGQLSVPAPVPAPKAIRKTDDPFDVQADIMDIFQNPSLLEDDAFAYTPSTGTIEKSVEERPEQDQDIDTQDIDTISVDNMDDIDEENDEDEEKAKEFIFGNPFEGPLPEVFHYDADLKRSLKDIGQDIDDQTQSITKPAPKKNGAKNAASRPPKK